MKLIPRQFGLAGGILWGSCMLIMTWISAGTGYAQGILQAISGIYPGYSVSAVGGIAGGFDGFLDAFIGLYLFAWLYNRLARNAQSS